MATRKGEFEMKKGDYKEFGRLRISRGYPLAYRFVNYPYTYSLRLGYTTIHWNKKKPSGGYWTIDLNLRNFGRLTKNRQVGQ